MSQQHRKWNELVKERIEKRGWSQTDLAIVVGVSPSAITQLFKDGKGSDDLKLRINKKLRINESWEKFEEQEGKMNELVWFYFTVIINLIIGFATYYASKRYRKKRINEYKKIQDDELERIRNKFNL